MLAQREFQTPNALDPGEAPPSRPDRRASSSSASSAQLRLHASRLLEDANHATSGRRQQQQQLLQYQAFPYDSPTPLNHDNDNDDDSYYVHDQLPSVEEARMYAGRILQAHSSRDLNLHDSNNTKESLEMEERAHLTNTVPIGIADDHRNRGLNLRDKRRCNYFCITLAAVCILFVTILAAVENRRIHGTTNPRRKDDDESNNNDNTSAATERLEQALQFLSDNEISLPATLTDLSSKQYQAAVWVADWDLLQYDIPTSLDEPNAFRFIQRYVLAVFYLSLNGPNWANQLHFMDKTDECAWFQPRTISDGKVVAVGVTCTENEEVEGILMPRNQLRGTLPTELALLTKLDFVDLNRNEIYSTIPTDFAALSKLDFFDLRYNLLSGELPSWIGGAWGKELVLLGLSDNDFEGTIPATYAQLTALKTLALDDNKLKGGLSVLNSMASLEFAFLERNRFNDRLDENFMKDCARLKQLDLNSNEITGNGVPVHLFEFPALEVLDLGDNSITSGLPEITQTNTALQYLALGDNVLDGPIPASISQLQKLEHLDVTGNILEGDIPASLANLSKLTFLFLSQNNFDEGPIPSWLVSMVQLRELSLSKTQRQGTIPSLMANLNELILLDISDNGLIGLVPQFLWELTNLQFLLIQRNEFEGQIPAGIDKLTDLRMFLLDRNKLGGSVEEVCLGDLQNTVEHLIADCEEVSCTCCTTCCSDEDGDGCTDQVLYEIQDGSWENGYQRIKYTFSPDLLFDGN